MLFLLFELFQSVCLRFLTLHLVLPSSVIRISVVQFSMTKAPLSYSRLVHYTRLVVTCQPLFQSFFIFSAIFLEIPQRCSVSSRCWQSSLSPKRKDTALPLAKRCLLPAHRRAWYIILKKSWHFSHKPTECQGVILNLSKKFIPREESSEMKSSSEVCQPSSFLGSWFM